MGKSAEEVQNEFAKMNGFQNEILWDLYTQDQADVLKIKIRSLIPDPSSSSQNMREVLFNSIWAQRKYTNRNLLTSIFYVCVVKETEVRAEALSAKSFSCHPVFRTRKCTANSNSSTCCMIYIDEAGRVYQNWTDYLTDNILPSGVMVAPDFGVYNFDDEKKIKLRVKYTPASSGAAKVLQNADSAFAVSGLVSAGIAIASICTIPVAAPLLAISSGVGLVSVGYSTLRSGSNLMDRNKHEQSLSLADREARNNWLGLAGGVAGFGSSAATGVLARSAAAGSNVPTITRAVVNGMNISSCLVAGSGVANVFLDMILRYRDDEKISAMDILQLAASLAMFTHSLNNFRLAEHIVLEAQNGRIQSYRESLSNRQRKMFDKMTKETMRISGTDRGRIDVIRSVSEMPSKQYLNDLNKINRQLNKEKVRPAFGGASKPVVLNSELAVDTQVLRGSVQHNIGPDILGQVKQPIPDSHVNTGAGGVPATSSKAGAVNLKFQKGVQASNRQNASGNKGGPLLLPNETIVGINELKNSKLILFSGAVIKFVEIGSCLFNYIKNPKLFEKDVQKIAKEVSDDSFYSAMDIAKEFIETSLTFIEEKLKIKIPYEHLMSKLFDIIICYDQNIRENLHKKCLEILRTLREYFSSFEYLNNSTLQDLRESIADLDDQFVEHVVDVSTFTDIIKSMIETFDDDTFRLLLKLAKSFIATKLPGIHELLKIHISAEDILHKILVHCLKNRTDLSCTALNQDFPRMLDDLENYYLSINPNGKHNIMEKCQICSGFYAECDL